MTTLHKAAREALIAWWKSHRPLDWPPERHAMHPTVNAQCHADKPLMEIAATLRAALDEAPCEEREAFEAWWAGLNPAPYYPGIEKEIARNAWKARAMLAARPEATTVALTEERPVRRIKRFQADRDGDCIHPLCPQHRDNEPHATGRHCPLDAPGPEGGA